MNVGFPGLLVPLLTLAVAAMPPPDRTAIQLHAEAGIGGLGRAGRWAPVRVSIESDRDAIDGELIVQWGDATLHRRLALAAPSRSVFELYVRTPEPRGTVMVRLRSRGEDLQSIEVPIRVAAMDGRVVLCIASSVTENQANPPNWGKNEHPPTASEGDGEDRSPNGCSTWATIDALPKSPRGYDAVDDVVWRAGPSSALTREQRTALDAWRGQREADATAFGSLAPRPLMPAHLPMLPRTSWIALSICAASLMLMAGVRWLGRRDRLRPIASLAAFAIVAVVGSTASMLDGRVGPGSSVLVRHATTVRQLSGGISTVSTRGIVEFPASGEFSVGGRVVDGVIDVKPAGGGARSEQWLDERGYPILAGTFGLGSRQEISLEGWSEYAPLQLVRADRIVRLSNTSNVDVRDCRSPDGFSPPHVTRLRPGESVELEELEPTVEPIVTCAVTEPAVDFFEPRGAVRTEGTTLVSVYVPPAHAPAVVDAAGAAHRGATP